MLLLSCFVDSKRANFLHTLTPTHTDRDTHARTDTHTESQNIKFKCSRNPKYVPCSSKQRQGDPWRPTLEPANPEPTHTHTHTPGLFRCGLCVRERACVCVSLCVCWKSRLIQCVPVKFIEQRSEYSCIDIFYLFYFIFFFHKI